ncbi:MAG: helix-turn-helix domain-containing protein [Eubacterium sp.]
MKFNENLRNLRREKDLSQEALATDMNVSRQTISKWENGTAMPDLKKLTELAEYFNVSMDTLLGTVVEKSCEDSAENNSSDNDNLMQYINDLLAYSEANQNAQNKKTIRRFYTILIVVIIAFALMLISIQNSFSNDINNLSQSLNILQNNINNLNNGNYAEDDYDSNITSKIISLGKDKPYIANVHFEYSPKSYPKNAEIYFLVPQNQGDAKKVQAILENGVFTADAEVDITANKEIYICIDDGNTVEKKTVPTYFVSDCFEITIQSSSEGTADTEYDPNDKTRTVSFQPYNTIKNDNKLYVYKGTEGKFTSAKLVAAHKGKEEYTKELTLKERIPDDNYANYTVQIPSVSFVLPFSENTEDDQNDTLYISLTDELGVEYRYYPFLDGNAEFNFALDYHCVLVFNTEAGQVIVNDNMYF